MKKANKTNIKGIFPLDIAKKDKNLKEEKKQAAEIESLIEYSFNDIKEFSVKKTESTISEIPALRTIEQDTKEMGLLESKINFESKESFVLSEPEHGIRYMSFEQAYSDYMQIRDISYASVSGTMNQSQLDILNKIGERLDRTKYVSASLEAVNLLVASKATLYKIRKYSGLA